jgi:hypothetical protein
MGVDGGEYLGPPEPSRGGRCGPAQEAHASIIG